MRTCLLFVCMLTLAVVPAYGQVVFTFTEDFEDPDWFDGEKWTKEGASHPEAQVVQFADGDPRLDGASIGSASGGVFFSLSEHGFYTGGDHGEVYLDMHMHVPPGHYTFEVELDNLVYWAEWLTDNPGQRWGAGQIFYLGDAADMNYGFQQPNEAPTGPWIPHGWPNASAFDYTRLGPAHWQGRNAEDNADADQNAVWAHRQHVDTVDPIGTIFTTGHVIFRMVLRNKWNISENMAYAMDNITIKLTSTLECNPLVFDVDGDGDVDMDDFGVFQACYTGGEVPDEGLQGYCPCFDRNFSGAIDDTDLAKFKACASGATVPAPDDPDCLYQ